MPAPRMNARRPAALKNPAPLYVVGLFSMARNTEDTVAGGKRSNRFMWWRVRLQLLTIILIVLWYLASRS